MAARRVGTSNLVPAKQANKPRRVNRRPRPSRARVGMASPAALSRGVGHLVLKAKLHDNEPLPLNRGECGLIDCAEIDAARARCSCRPGVLLPDRTPATREPVADPRVD